MNRLSFILGAGGAGTLTAGVWLYSMPAGLIALGAALITLAVLLLDDGRNA